MSHLKTSAFLLAILFAAFTAVEAGAAGKRLVTRRYAVVPGIEDGMVCEEEARVAPDGPYNVRAFFEKEGLAFPDGSSIVYEPLASTLRMVNTEENHAALKALLPRLGVVPTQVEIEATVVAFGKDEIAGLVRNGLDIPPSSTELKRLLNSGRGSVLQSLKLVTRTGVNAQTKSVREHIYPTEFTVVPASKGDSNAVAVSKAFAVEPASFETRESGAILNVTPTVGPNGRILDVTFVFELCSEPEWQEIATSCATTNGAVTRVSITQPVFHSRQVTTSVILANGTTLVLGGLGEPGDTTVSYLLLTATVIDAEGNPLPGGLVF